MFFSCKEDTIVIEEEQCSIQVKSNSATPGSQSSNFKVVGYLNGSVDSWADDITTSPIDQLTDIIFAFINPDINGDFILSPEQKTKMISAVTKGHDNDLRVYLSFGGGLGPEYWDDLIIPANRGQVISNLRQLVTTYNFDGLDVDLENARVTNANYSPFVLELSDTIRSYDKLLTAALVKHSSEWISDDALQKFDFINIMGYDFSFEIGDGTPPRPHSSLTKLKDQYDYYRWRGIAANKIVLGVPAYAHGWDGVKHFNTLNYDQMIAAHPNAYALNHQVHNGVPFFYDGHPAIREKVKFALEEGVAGMMMWQIMGDTRDETSLLRLINHCVNNPGGFYATSYDISNKIQGNLLEVKDGATTDGGNIHLSASTTSVPCYQNWVIEHLQNTDYVLKNVESNQYMDIAEQSSANEANIVQWPWTETNSQKFKLFSNENGYYFIESLHSGKLVTVDGLGGGAASNVYQLEPTFSDRQQWVIKYN